MERFRRRVLVVAAALLAGLAAPAASEASVEKLRQCTQEALNYFAPDPLDRYYVLTISVYMCTVQYAHRATSTARFEEYLKCMERAVDSYTPYTGIEPPIYYGHLCTEAYVGLDVHEPA